MTHHTDPLVALLPPPECDDDWRDQALCAQTDPEAFFPEKGGTSRPAKDVCRGCVVRVPCLQHALDHEERFGIFGGYSERERRKMRGKRAVDVIAVDDFNRNLAEIKAEADEFARQARISNARSAAARARNGAA